MTRTVRLVMLVPVVVVLLAAPLGAQKTKAKQVSGPVVTPVTAAESMNFLQAEKYIRDVLIHKQSFPSPYVRFQRTKIIYGDVTSTPPQSLVGSGKIVVMRTNKSLLILVDEQHSSDNTYRKCGVWCSVDSFFLLTWPESDQTQAQKFADAMNVLIDHVYGRDADQVHEIQYSFPVKAAAWRALPAKPPLSDAVRMHELAAEDAFKQKNFDKAIEEYEAGLDIEPMWPDVQYNVALLYGETQQYELAAYHMVFYQHLRPDAPDAKAVHDQVLLWQEKASQQ